MSLVSIKGKMECNAKNLKEKAARLVDRKSVV